MEKEGKKGMHSFVNIGIMWGAWPAESKLPCASAPPSRKAVCLCMKSQQKPSAWSEETSVCSQDHLAFSFMEDHVIFLKYYCLLFESQQWLLSHLQAQWG